MQTFKNLYEFIGHCEEVIEEAKEVNENDFALLAVMAQANYMNPERLINDARITLSVYYDFLKESIEEEMFDFAVLIVDAKNIEIEHYIHLAKTIMPDDAKHFKKQIIALDLILNDHYLSPNE
jgi:hypothetical protein